MLGGLFGKKQSSKPKFIVAQLNARLQPVHRGEIFEDPLNEALIDEGLGEVSGGGTMEFKDGEVEFCDLEISVATVTETLQRRIIAILEGLGAPKGSRLMVDGEEPELTFGTAEGLAIYLNGTDLPEQTYKECDSNFVLSEFDRLLAGEGRVLSYWQGPSETAFYAYGPSFATMKALLANFLSEYPLCERCRIQQIA